MALASGAARTIQPWPFPMSQVGPHRPKVRLGKEGKFVREEIQRLSQVELVWYTPPKILT